METGHGAVLGGGSRYRLPVSVAEGPRAKHRASRMPFQVVVGHIRMLGEYHEPEGRGTDDRLAPPGWH